MLYFLPWPILLPLNLCLMAFNILLCATPVLAVDCFRLLLPFRWAQVLAERCNYGSYRMFAALNAMAIALTNRIEWDVRGNDFAPVHRSCIIICNHLSWADIVLLCHIYRGRIPTMKFFLKKSLLYIPVLGQACWGLGMPFLNRYSRAQLIRNPALRARDLESTRRACRRLSYAPLALINFVEGTRYTPQKAALANSPYRHLMVPKSPALAIAMGELGHEIEALFNTTLCYRDNARHPFIDLLMGRMKSVYARIERLENTEDLIGNYLEDKHFKHDFGMRLRELWAQKDTQLDAYLSQSAPESAPEVSAG